MSYGPFGEPNVNTGVTLRYTGQLLDADSGLYYYKARWYSPYLGRFLSPDPALLIDGLQTYKYVGNDPVNFSDPSGNARQLARRWWPRAKPWLEWAPGIGDAIAIHDAWKNPSWTNTLAAGIGLIPGAGDAAGKLLKHSDEIADIAKSTLQANKAAGRAAEIQAAKDLQAEGNKILGSQVGVQTSEGLRVVDHLYQTPTGDIIACEAKCGGGYRNQSQLAKDAAMGTEGETIVGKNAPTAIQGQTLIIPTVKRRY